MTSQEATASAARLEPAADRFAGTGRAAVFAALAVLCVLRIIYMALVPLDLAADEAYYWDWSRRIDWSYYSKPPLTAWIIGLATRLGGDHVFMIRLPAVVLGTFSVGFLYLLAERMYGPRAGRWAALTTVVAPGSAALSLLMTIDAPMIFCWNAALYFWRRVLERPTLRSGWFAAAVLATGCGLLAKQTMLAFFPATVLFLCLSRPDRAALRRPTLWLWGVVSLSFLVPVVWWNAQHDWITVQHTGGHFGGAGGGVGRHVLLGLEYAAGQAGVASPIAFLLGSLVGIGSLLTLPRCDRRARYLLSFGVIPLAGVALLSFAQRVQPNWPAPFCGAGCVLFAGWAAGAVSTRDGIDRYRSWCKPGLALGAVLSLGVYLAPFAVGPLGLAGAAVDATFRLRGWDELGREIGRAKASLPRPDDTLIVMATDRSPVSEVAFYAPGRPRVYRWNTPGTIDSQHEIWGGPTDAADCDALIVTLAGCPVPPDLAELFQRIEPRGDVQIPLGRNRRLAYQLWHGVSSRSWPTARAFTASSNFR